MNDEYGNAKRALDDDWTANPTNFQTTKLPEIAVDISPPTDFDGDDEIVSLVRGAGSDKKDEKEKSDGWKMPEPVFRVSEGKTPDKSEKSDNSNNAAQTDLPFSEAISLEKISADTLIQSQPNISQEFTISDASEKTSAKTGSKNFNILFVVLGLIALIVFAVAFLVTVYFLFFYKAEM